MSKHNLVKLFDGFIVDPNELKYLTLDRRKPFGENEPKWSIYVSGGNYSFPIFFKSEYDARRAFAEAANVLGLNPTEA